ncbi:MAG: GlcG/HbpS family heme-binding protein, partial [Casimicrobiaceae bacterium]
MSINFNLRASVLLMFLALPGHAIAQTQTAVGNTITTDDARKVAEAAIAEARKNGWTEIAAIVDPAGDLVYFERMDGAQVASINLAIQKGRS